MGATKTGIFTEYQNHLALMFKALAHPARVAILQQIINTKSCICSDLVNEFGLAQATISQHLKELKSAGLIQGNIEGVSVCYCIEPKAWKILQEQTGKFFAGYEHVNKCC